MAINIVMLNGRIGKDLELRKSQSGVSNVRFTLAVNGNRKNEQGETETNWINCIAFNKTAELLAQYCSKGSKISVRGSIQTGSYSKDNVTHYTTDIIVQEIEFLDSKKETQQQAPQQQQQQIYNPNTAQLQQMQQGFTQQINTSHLAPQFGQPQQQQQQVIDQSQLPF